MRIIYNNQYRWKLWKSRGDLIHSSISDIYLTLIARTSTGIRDELVHGRKGQVKDQIDKCSHQNDNHPVPPREAPCACRTLTTGT